jgi:hypothetical protein
LGKDVAIPKVLPGQTAALQVRVWFNQGGAIPTYEAALAAKVLHGKCPLFTSLPLGGGTPPRFSPFIINNAKASNNMQAIVCTLKPEPPRPARLGF